MDSLNLPTEDLWGLYDDAPCGYVSITSDARIVQVNRTLADWLQWSRDDLLGKPLHEILSFGGKIAFETHLAPMLRLEGEVHEIAFDLQMSDGKKLPVMGNAREKRGPDGEHQFTRLTLFRAIERRSFERSLIEAKIRAEERFRTEHDQLELRDQFIAVLGHDLRNPLAAIEAGLRMLERQNFDEGGRSAIIIEEMRASLGRANALIDDVLDFAMGRLGSGISLEYTENSGLEQALRQVIQEIEAIDSDVEIVREIGDLEQVECDPDRIAQLASNLLSNAVRYGDGDKPISLKAFIEGERFVLSVANSGDPIPDSARERLFQPFQRGQVSKRDKGLGLGLFIVREIASAHGGRVDVSSEEEQTTFTLSMPLRRP